MNKQELDMIKSAIETHTRRLLADAETYKKANNPEAVRDCLDEVRKYNELVSKL